MTDPVEKMPEKLIIESEVQEDEKNKKLDQDELSLSQELLEESQVQNNDIDKIDPENPDKNSKFGSNTSVKPNENINMQRYFTCSCFS